MDPSEAKQRFATAKQLYQAGMYRDAFGILDELYQSFPGNEGVASARNACLRALEKEKAAGGETAKPKRKRGLRGPVVVGLVLAAMAIAGFRLMSSGVYPGEEDVALPPAVFEGIDLAGAVIAVDSSAPLQAKAAQVLKEEIEKRTGLALEIVDSAPGQGVSAIVLGTTGSLPGGGSPPTGAGAPDEAEAYALRVEGAAGGPGQVYLVGHDDRGTFFAVGRFLRTAQMAPDKLLMDPRIAVSTAPKYPYRGHQLGYRNTANSYDSWTPKQFEQYFRDLVLFGTNSIELITDLDPRKKDGPIMARTQYAMGIEMSKLLDSYGLDVWLWLPAEDDLSDAAAAMTGLQEREDLFAAWPRLDHVMVPGGDPGSNAPEVLMPWLEQLAGALHKSHPEAGLWVSNQGFEPDENAWFFSYLRRAKPKWLKGVVFGPWAKMSIKDVRTSTPKDYPIRRYPDITHCVRCQYPMPDWDPALALTLNREPCNPRPVQTAHTHNLFAEYADGAITYSDGCHDDFNKMVWSALAWDPAADVKEIAQDYGRAFFGHEHADAVAEGLYMLERNWQGPLAENAEVARTLKHWEAIAEAGGPALAGNWRFQLHLMRAYYDAYIQEKLAVDTKCEERAYRALKKGVKGNVADAIQAAREELAKGDEPVAPELRARIEQLGNDLLASIGFQFSVDPPFLARNIERGALLDMLDRPLNDRAWLESRFQDILAGGGSNDAIAQIVNWEDPGRGGFYDDLGDPTNQPHVVPQRTWEQDPGYVEGTQCEYGMGMNKDTKEAEPLRISWLNCAQTLFGTPLKMHYDGLDTGASYKLRVTYAGRYGATMTLTANGSVQIHGPVKQPSPIAPVEYDVPQAATQSGSLDLEWNLVDGRGCQVAEAWLIKQ